MFNSISRRIVAALAVIGVLGLLLAAPPASAAGEGPLTNNQAPATGQRIGWLPFQGAPTIVNGKTDFWVWNENVNGQNKLHIRTTTNGQTHVFTGTVTTGSRDNFYNLAVVNNGGTDRANLLGYNRFNLSLSTSGQGDGVDVDWSGRWLSLNLFVDGLHRPVRVLYGATATPARAMPLIVLAGKKGLLALPLTVLDGPTPFTKNIADGYYLYRDAKGYHLRLTTTKVGEVVDYKGTLFADGATFGSIKLFRGDPADYYRLIGGTTLDFRFITNGGQDGLDWSLPRGGLILTLKMNGQIAAPNIALGSNPFGQVQAFTFRLTP